jgi:SAM-dependent methyltransferase
MGGNGKALSQGLLERLCCPRDGAPLRVQDEQGAAQAGNDLVCTRCATHYPVRDKIPRFVPGDQYVGNFSHEWTVHRTTQLDSAAQRISETTFAAKTGWRPRDVRGKRVLDVGCGMGRFADVVLRWGGEVVGVDLSFAVDSAQANLGHRPDFHVVQASVFDLPFPLESFDLIYSLGVLHHTPDCRKAFKCLPRLLRPGGEIAVWVYSAHSYGHEGVEETRDRFYRRYTTRMAPERLHSLCRVLCRIRLKHRAFWHMVLPGAVFHAIPRLHHTYDDYQRRVLDTFDWYSPAYQSKHSYPEVCRWFREAGLVDVIPLDVEVSVRGRKPSEPTTAA